MIVECFVLNQSITVRKCEPRGPLPYESKMDE